MAMGIHNKENSPITAPKSKQPSCPMGKTSTSKATAEKKKAAKAAAMRAFDKGLQFDDDNPGLAGSQQASKDRDAAITKLQGMSLSLDCVVVLTVAYSRSWCYVRCKGGCRGLTS